MVVVVGVTVGGYGDRAVSADSEYGHVIMAWADGFAWFWLLLCAAALGSFANVLVYRLPMQIVGV